MTKRLMYASILLFSFVLFGCINVSENAVLLYTQDVNAWIDSTYDINFSVPDAANYSEAIVVVKCSSCELHKPEVLLNGQTPKELEYTMGELKLKFTNINIQNKVTLKKGFKSSARVISISVYGIPRKQE